MVPDIIKHIYKYHHMEDFLETEEDRKSYLNLIVKTGNIEDILQAIEFVYQSRKVWTLNDKNYLS